MAGSGSAPAAIVSTPADFLTASSAYPELAEYAHLLTGRRAVPDGEITALERPVQDQYSMCALFGGWDHESAQHVTGHRRVSAFQLVVLFAVQLAPAGGSAKAKPGGSRRLGRTKRSRGRRPTPISVGFMIRRLGLPGLRRKRPVRR